MATQPNSFAPQLPGSGQSGQSSSSSPCPPGKTRILGRCVSIQTSQAPGAPPSGPTPKPSGERVDRYTPQQRAEFRARNRKAAAGAKYGYDYASQGYRPEKEAGQSFLAKQDLKFRTFGAFTPTSWDMKCATGGSLEGCPPEQLLLKAKARQVGRQAEGFADWRPASQVLPQGHYAALVRSNQRFGAQRQAFRAANPGADMSHWLASRFASGLKAATPEAIAAAGYNPAQFAGQDIRMLRSGELRTASGQNIDDQGRPIGFRSSATGQPISIGAAGAAGVPGAAAGPRGVTPQPGASAPGAPGAAPGSPLADPGAAGAVGQGGLQDEITNYLRQIVQGGGPFGDAETAAQLAGARSATEGAAQTAREQAQFDLIRSGMARSPATARRTYADIQRGAASDYARAATQIRLERATRNFDARMQALNGMAQQLQGARQYAIAQAQTELERRRIAQNYDLALRNISLAQQQMAQQMSQFNQSLGFQREQFDWTRTTGSCPVQQPDGTTVTVPIPCSELARGFV